MTSLLLTLPSRLHCLDEDEQEESNFSGSLDDDFFILLLKKLSLFWTFSLCCPESINAQSRLLSTHYYVSNVKYNQISNKKTANVTNLRTHFKHIYTGIQENIFKKCLLHRDGKKDTLQERNFKIISKHKYHEQQSNKQSYKQSKLQKINGKMQERQRDILLQNTLVTTQVIKIKKSQFYYLFGYSTKKLKE